MKRARVATFSDDGIRRAINSRGLAVSRGRLYRWNGERVRVTFLFKTTEYVVASIESPEGLRPDDLRRNVPIDELELEPATSVSSGLGSTHEAPLFGGRTVGERALLQHER